MSETLIQAKQNKDLGIKNVGDTVVLIVDDEEGLRNVIGADFKRKGYQVLTAADGQEAMDILKANPDSIDVVLSDIRMPRLGGLELLHHIKKHYPIAPVVILMSGFSEVTLEEAYDAGAEAVFTKPFDRKALFEAVQASMVPKAISIKRRQKRVQSDLPTHLKFEGPAGTSSATRVLNIGRGGMFIVTEEPHPKVGMLADFRIELTGRPSIRIEGLGIVRWVRSQNQNGVPSGCGIEFVSLDDRSRSQVLELINSIQTRSLEADL